MMNTGSTCNALDRGNGYGLETCQLVKVFERAQSQLSLNENARIVSHVQIVQKGRAGLYINADSSWGLIQDQPVD